MDKRFHLKIGGKEILWNYENGRIYSTDEKGELMCEATFIRKENGEMDRYSNILYTKTSFSLTQSERVNSCFVC